MYSFTSPMAQDFNVVYNVPSDCRTDGPSMLILPSGRLVASFVVLNTLRSYDLNANGSYTVTTVSSDSGKTWRETARLPYELALLFENKGSVYLIGFEAGRGDIVITRSSDEGETWSNAVSIIKGKFWNTSTGSVKKDGKFYWCVGASNEEGEWNSSCSRTVAICADLSMDLLTPEAWRRSEYLLFPGSPGSLRANLCDKPGHPYHDHWLEGNVALTEDNQSLRAYWRVRFDGQSTPGICAVCDITDNGEKLGYSFKMFYPLPGAQNHFHIIKDEQTGVYYMLSNLPTHSQTPDYGFGHGLRGGERRLMTLACSFDGMDWLPLGYTVIWPKMRQGSNYSTPVIYGDDLLIITRTSRDALNQHDNDLITFHRIKNFRDLVKPLVMESFS